MFGALTELLSVLGSLVLIGAFASLFLWDARP